MKVSNLTSHNSFSDETITPNSNSNSSVNSTNLAVVGTSNTTDVSYNQPSFDSYTVWNSNGITFTDNTTIKSSFYSIFIDKYDTIYVPGANTSSIYIWTNNSLNSPTTLNTSSWQNYIIFVTNNNDIYTNNPILPYEIVRWNSNGNQSDIAAYGDDECLGLFVDINNTLYFSIRDLHKIMARSLTTSLNTLTTVAGAGCSGNTASTLNSPRGIFVDIDLNLYVADCNNNRIQRFQSASSNAITVAGTGSINVTIDLNNPVAIVLDADNYLFIVDYGNNRIVGSGSNGFRCISGSISNMLTSPTSMAFDSRGNIYVVDQGNNRIQKFVRLNNNQTPTYNQPRFCANATWDSNGTTFADSSIVGSTPNGLFIDTNNTVYIPNRSNNRIYIWFNNDTSPTITFYGNLSLPKSLFVTMNGDIYVDNGKINGRVDLFTLNSNTSISIMSVPGNCYGLFIDISNTIYCSVDSANQVFKKWLGDNSSVITTVAGNGFYSRVLLVYSLILILIYT